MNTKSHIWTYNNYLCYQINWMSIMLQVKFVPVHPRTAYLHRDSICRRAWYGAARFTTTLKALSIMAPLTTHMNQANRKHFVHSEVKRNPATPVIKRDASFFSHSHWQKPDHLFRYTRIHSSEAMHSIKIAIDAVIIMMEGGKQKH